MRIHLTFSDEYKKISADLNLSYLDLVLHVGEDFELLFTISEDNLENLDVDYKIIGEVTESNTVEMVLEDGSTKEIENRGYEHYVSE